MQNNPAQNAPEIILPMERLDQVLFNLDTSYIKDTLLDRNTRYPFISEVLLKQMLAIDSVNSEKGLFSFLHAYRPVYNAVQKLNAPATAHPQLQPLNPRLQARQGVHRRALRLQLLTALASRKTNC